MHSEKSARKTEDIKELSCGTCAFFGKPVICLRREKYAGAIPCGYYKRKVISSMFPLLPDAGVRESKERMTETPRPSLAWYLVPFFFGILGGIVGYVAVKDRDEDMALGLLFFGIIWTVIGVILYAIVISSYLRIPFLVTMGS